MKTYNANLTVVDPWANPVDVKNEYNITTLTEIPNDKYDAIIVDEVQDLTEIQIKAIVKMTKQQSNQHAIRR